MDETRMQRRMLLAAAAVLLALTVLYPWAEVWPAEDPAALVLEDPVYRFADIYPRATCAAWWTHGHYARVSVMWGLVGIQALAIVGFAGWGWTALGQRAAVLRSAR